MCFLYHTTYSYTHIEHQRCELLAPAANTPDEWTSATKASSRGRFRTPHGDCARLQSPGDTGAAATETYPVHRDPR